MRPAKKRRLLEPPKGARPSAKELIGRIQRARKNLGPRNVYGCLLDECVLAITDLSVQLREAEVDQAEAHAAKPAGGVTVTRPVEDPTPLMSSVLELGRTNEGRRY